MANTAERYRRLAQECRRIADAQPPGSSSRGYLFEMARLWERLTHEVAASRIPPSFPAIKPERPTMQQQQQDQPERKGEEWINSAHEAAIKVGHLTLKRASTSRPSGEWSDDDYNVLAAGQPIGRIFKANASPVGSAWMWTLMVGYEDRTPTHGYAATREAAMAAFAKSWRRE